MPTNSSLATPRGVFVLLSLAACACSGVPSNGATRDELPVVVARCSVPFELQALTSCELLRDRAANDAFWRRIGREPPAMVRDCDFARHDVLVVATANAMVAGEVEVSPSTEEGVDVLTIEQRAPIPADRAAPPHSDLHCIVLLRRECQLAVVLREPDARGETTLRVFDRAPARRTVSRGAS